MIVNTFEIIFLSSKDGVYKISYFGSINDIEEFIKNKNIEVFLITEVMFLRTLKLKELLEKISFEYIGYEKNTLVKIPVKMVKYNNISDFLLFFKNYYENYIKDLQEIGFYNLLSEEKNVK